MKCAAEIISIQSKAIAEQERGKVVKHNIRDEFMQGSTIRLCENIGKILEIQAANGLPISHSFYAHEELGCPHAVDVFDRELLIVQEREHSRYADSRPDYDRTGCWIDADMMRAYFSKYCYEVSCEKEWGYIYGSGAWLFVKFTITPKPSC